MNSAGGEREKAYWEDNFTDGKTIQGGFKFMKPCQAKLAHQGKDYPHELRDKRKRAQIKYPQHKMKNKNFKEWYFSNFQKPLKKHNVSANEKFTSNQNIKKFKKSHTNRIYESSIPFITSSSNYMLFRVYKDSNLDFAERWKDRLIEQTSDNDQESCDEIIETGILGTLRDLLRGILALMNDKTLVRQNLNQEYFY